MGYLNVHLESIARAIQLSVAPVFMLAGVGAVLNVIVGRLVRIVDRARITEVQLNDADELLTQELHERLRVLARRATLISRAIALSVLSALLVPCVIVCLFVSELFAVNLAVPIAIAFITGLVSLAIGLVYFLREIFVATAAMKIGMISDRSNETQQLRKLIRNS